MLDRRDVLCAAAGLTGVLAGCAGGDGGGGSTAPLEGLSIESPAFEDGAAIPDRHTCAGADQSPPLRVGVPGDVSTLALVVDDPDAGGFTHWTLWDVPAGRREIPAGVPRESIVLDAARQGRNGFGELGYRGPCPPEGEDPHTYRFTLYGVDGALGLTSGAEPAAVREALAKNALGTARLTGEFGR